MQKKRKGKKPDILTRPVGNAEIPFRVVCGKPFWFEFMWV